MLHTNLPTAEIALRLIIAAILGSLVGLDRERKEGAAGLRTHMLVCVGTCLAMIVSAFGFQDVLGRPDVTLDPSRIAAQVISGVGFLGAGTILFLRPQLVRGLTTAAGLWTVAAVGLAVGGGLYWAAIIATGITLIILIVLKPLTHTLFRRTRRQVITLTVPSRVAILAQIEAVILRHALPLAELQVHTMPDDTNDQVKLVFDHRAERGELLAALDELRSLPGIGEIVSRL